MVSSRGGLGEAVSRGRHELTDPVQVSVHAIPRSWEIEQRALNGTAKLFHFTFPHIYVLLLETA